MKTEFGLSITFILALLFKFFHLPGGSVLLVLSLLTLSLVYFPFAFYFMCNKTIKQQNIPFSVLTGMFFSVAVTGILFKIQYWPGSTILLGIAIVPVIVILIVSAILFRKSAQELIRYYRNMIIRAGIITFFTVLFFVVSGNTLLKIQYRNDPEYVRLMIQRSSNPNNTEFEKQLEDYRHKKDSLWMIQELNQNQHQ